MSAAHKARLLSSAITASSPSASSAVRPSFHRVAVGAPAPLVKPRYLSATPHRFSDPPTANQHNTGTSPTNNTSTTTSTPSSVDNKAAVPVTTPPLPPRSGPYRQQARPRPVPGKPTNQAYSEFKFWPFLIIFVCGSVLFSQVVKQRQGTKVRENANTRFL